MAAGDWSSLPADLVKEVSSLLSSDGDLLRIHQVCMQWRSFTSPPAIYRPWVAAISPCRSGRIKIRDYPLRQPHRGELMSVHAPPAGLCYLCGASRGWLALVDDEQSPTRLVLWEPLSNTQIPLPCLNPITRIFLSDDPLKSPDWVAIATQLKGIIGQRTLLLRPGDTAWTMMNERGTLEIDSITFLGGKAYYMDIKKNIVICDLTDPPKITPIFYVYYVVNTICKCDRRHAMRDAQLVACNNDILLVVFYHESHPSPAEISKVEFTTDGRLELRDRVMDLGDHSLFLGRGDTFALSAKEFPSIKRNCVYTVKNGANPTGNPYRKDYWIWVFHLDSNVLEEIKYPEELEEDKTNWVPHFWFCPREPLRKKQ